MTDLAAIEQLVGAKFELGTGALRADGRRAPSASGMPLASSLAPPSSNRRHAPCCRTSARWITSETLVPGGIGYGPGSLCAVSAKTTETGGWLDGTTT